MNGLNVKQFAASVFLCLTVLLAGCALPAGQGGGVPDIGVDSRGIVTVDDLPVRIGDLPRVLRRARTPPDRMLVVHYADDTGKGLIPEITAVLRRAGFRKVLFVGRHKASATVAE